MYAQFTNILLVTLIVATIVAVVTTPVFAQEATSSSFMVRNSSINSFGGSGTSSSFSSEMTDDQLGGGESTSTSFSVRSGFMYFDAFTPLQQKWRWYDDENNETPTNPIEAEDVSPSTISNLNIIKLRVSVKEAGGIDGTNLKFALQFATSSDFSGPVTNVAESADCAPDSGWCYANGAGADNAVISTALLSDSDACTFSTGSGCGTHNESGTSTSSFTQTASSTTEYEFTIQESGTVANTVYFFRLVNTAGNAPVALNTGQSYPSIASQSGTLSFSINGVASSTVTSGITTDIDTTSNAVPFGSLLASSSASGAQRLTVTTNAGQGYSIYSYSTQGFLGASGGQITPITGTNQSPVDWDSGCATALSGCFGYHTNEPVLSGGSTRFAADNTYAKFDTTPAEVDYSSGATTSKSTDIVYKLQVRPTQESDVYSTSVVYIVVPVF